MSDSISVILSDKGTTVYTIHPDATVFEAVCEMNRCRVGSIVVVNRKGITGIFTERDVLTRVIVKELDPKTVTVEQVMTRNPIVLSPQTSIDETMDLMRDKRCRHLPVVEKGQIKGLISIGDVVRWVSRIHECEAENLRAYISGSYI